MSMLKVFEKKKKKKKNGTVVMLVCLAKVKWHVMERHYSRVIRAFDCGTEGDGFESSSDMV